ncbi:uncharacterized protein [Physcomitrium patens]|uniref:uncharacterized protein n=1 Tax=Physcomitrium patens TaxID=3218 RepID=UPI00024ADAD3
MLPDLDGTAWGDLLDACRNHGDVEMAVPTAEGGTIGCLYVQGSSSISMLQLPNRTRSHLLAVRVKEQMHLCRRRKEKLWMENSSMQKYKLQQISQLRTAFIDVKQCLKFGKASNDSIVAGEPFNSWPLMAVHHFGAMWVRDPFRRSTVDRLHRNAPCEFSRRKAGFFNSILARPCIGYFLQ